MNEPPRADPGGDVSVAAPARLGVPRDPQVVEAGPLTLSPFAPGHRVRCDGLAGKTRAQISL